MDFYRYPYQSKVLSLIKKIINECNFWLIPYIKFYKIVAFIKKLKEKNNKPQISTLK